MKNLIKIIIVSSLFAACSPKEMDNNTHAVAPIETRDLQIDKKFAENIGVIEANYNRNRPLVYSGNAKKVISAIKSMEAYVLNEDNLINPELNLRGQLHPMFRKLIETYTYALNWLVNENKVAGDAKVVLGNFKGTIFNTCHASDTFCEEATAFRGPYAVGVLAFMIKNDLEEAKIEIKRLKAVDEKDPKIKSLLRDVIFSLYVLKYFGEVETNLTADLFIQLSGTFFTSLDVKNLSDSYLKSYLTDLQRLMVKQSREEASPESCSIFNILTRKRFNNLVETVRSSLATQLTKHYYNCHTPAQILAKIESDEQERKDKALDLIEKNGQWSEYFKNYHARKHILDNNFKDVLDTYGLNRDIPISLINLMDKVFYGQLETDEKEIIFSRFTEDDLIAYIKLAEVYAKTNFLYSMQFTFEAYNQALVEAYEEHGVINSKFVQDVYDNLKLKTGDTWYNYKEYVEFLRNGLDDVFLKISPAKKKELQEEYSALRNHKLETVKVTNLINIAVSYPIVLATTYFAGVDGGGTIDLKVSYFGGVSETIKITTVRPLERYFTALLPNVLQLVDFGSRGYQPHELERNFGLGAAIRNGFFQTVNLDLGKDNQGTIHNLKLFFDRYVEQNQSFAELAVREIEDLRKTKDNYWDRVKQICENPIKSERRILLNNLYGNFYTETKESSGSVSSSDLDYTTKVYDKQTYIENLSSEIDRMKRTYRVILGSLDESGIPKASLETDMQKALRPHFATMKRLVDTRDELLVDIDLNGDFCLNGLAKMERFQQNILQRQSIDYLAQVHAAMEIARNGSFVNKIQATDSLVTDSNSDGEVDEKDVKAVSTQLVSDIKAIAQSELSGITDEYQKLVMEQLVSTKALNAVVRDLGFSGKKALVEALNLILSPHNMDEDFGFVITDMVVRAKSLDDPNSYLRRRGGFDQSLFVINKTDQFFRVREEVKGLVATSAEIAKYFDRVPRVMNELDAIRTDLGKSKSEVFEVRLNQNLTVHIENFKHFKDKLGSSDKEARVRFKSDRESFIRESLEKLYGLNQQGQQIFNWSQEHIRPKYIGSFYTKNLESFKMGPIFLPKRLDENNFDLSCNLSADFDQMKTPRGCDRLSVEADQVLKEFVNRAEYMYYGDEELFPLHPGVEESEYSDFDRLVMNTYFSSDWIANYNPSTVIQYFQYYKKKTEPDQWTWFDKFLSKEFTTGLGRDRLHRPVNVPILPGTFGFEQFFAAKRLGPLNNLLFDLNETTIPLFRRYYRSYIAKSISTTEAMIEEMRKAEFKTYGLEEEVAQDGTVEVAVLPEIQFTREDYKDISSADPREFVSLEIKTRGNGSLKLLEDVNPALVGVKLDDDEDEDEETERNMFEVEQYLGHQVSIFEKYECELLPKPGDRDYSKELFDFYSKEKECEDKAKAWMKFKVCQQAKDRQKLYPGFESDIFCTDVE